ncbi:MAG TPA: patatin-like phospholipase family protein [Pyrinomonadaceae bacterium]|nr:patatin-like phospholipase family protein [Pyrinomonadaceae bacterium]
MNTGIKLVLLILLSASVVSAREIRVGITEYQNVESVYNKYQLFFEELEKIARRQGSDTTFSFAIGSYGEVIDWYNKKLIDVAVLSAMPMADLLTSSDARETAKIRDAFLARLNPIAGSSAKCEKDFCQRSLDELSPSCRATDATPGNAQSEYHASVVVPAEYGWTSFEDVRKLAGQKRLKFLFVRPVSISGYIVPLYYLKKQGIDLKQEEFDFSYQHQESLQRILRKDGRDAGKFVVAFVIENTSYCVPESAANSQLFTKLDAKELSSIEIPHEVMLVNTNLDETAAKEIKDTLGKILSKGVENEKNVKDKNFTLTLLDPKKEDWLTDFDQARNIYETTRGARSLQYGSTLKDLITSLDTYQESTGKRPRLALVLSGGGAKCAYQAGAISQIENKLKQLGKRDFELVVGTSGGAINALLAALGGTQDRRTQEAIREMWVGFHQEQFFTPSRVFNFVFGLCFGVLQALVITFAVLLFGRRELRWKRIGQLLLGVEVVEIILAVYLGAVTSSFALLVLVQVGVVVAVAAVIRGVRYGALWLLKTRPGHFWRELYNQKVGEWWRIAGWLMIIIATIEILVARGLNPPLWPAALESHTVSHLWLIFLLMCSVSYPWPLILGLFMVASGFKGHVEIDWHSRRVWLVRMLTMLVLIFAGVLFLTSLWKDRSPSDSAEIEKAFSQRIPEMLNILHPGFGRASGSTQQEQLHDVSERIINVPSLFKRDLVITVSNLPIETSEEPENPRLVTANQLPEDLYFYCKSPHVEWEPPPPERRFISFQENPQRLLDVVIGSGTIYPLFPYRELSNINVGRNKQTPLLKIIDGGFIHNSPIEAAIKWGATHIISIEASPERKPFEPTNTLENSLVAFSYIMAQTQRADTTARGQVEIFELRPRSDCEKKNLEVGCNHDPEPNMDTFDFDPQIVGDAFTAGENDVKSDRPLFKRVPGPPLLRHTRPQYNTQVASR